MKGPLNLLREFSIPLVVGVCFALTWANIDPEQYHTFLHNPVSAGFSLHFLTNDLFMTLFFGLAAVEITQSCLPGGDLHPLKRALNPLLAIGSFQATAGGAKMGAMLSIFAFIPAAVVARWGRAERRHQF